MINSGESEILLGFSFKDGEPVNLPIHHTVFVGITGIGKTEAIKALASRAPESAKFLFHVIQNSKAFFG